MKTSFISPRALLCCCLLITGCYERGVFVGPVEGLSYSTPSTSGVTTAQGEFQYKKGETVTFSIGGIELGSAPGAATVSPFDFFGMAPPTAELALRLELNTRNDVTDFDRAANIAFLLFSLDNDANPDNGLDVTGWDAALAAAELDFNANLYKFAKKFRRFAGANGINPDVAPTQPMTHLYKSMGLVIPVHLVSTVISDFGNDGIDESAVVFGYDDRGLTNSWTSDWNNDGILNIEDSFTYTAQGRPATFRRALDFDDDGIPNSVEGEISAYNGSGDLASFVRDLDFDGDAAPNYRETLSHVYNELGELVSSRNEIDVDFDGITDMTVDSTYAYDADGNLLTQVQEQDSDLDGNPETRDTHVYTYDSAGNQLTRQLSMDFGIDGIIDLTENEVSTYDAAGNRLTHRFETDFVPADGVVDAYQAETSTYDDLGNALTLVLESVDHINNFSRTMFFTYSYNSDRTLLMARLRQEDHDLDGEFDDFSSNTSYTYDDFGNWLSQFEEIDFDADGTVDSTNLTRHNLVTHDDGMFSLMFHYSDLTRF